VNPATRNALCAASLPLMAAILCLAAVAARGQDDAMDRIDESLSFGGWNDQVRLRVSGVLDLEGYYVTQTEPGLISEDRNAFLNPRLSLFVDAQVGPYVYAFAQERADNGFDPGESGQRVRPDEYVLRLTPWSDGRFNVQVGKFATVVGNWTLRHGSWDNPFITAPLPYENLTGIWDTNGARSAEELMYWAGVRPAPVQGGAFLNQYRNLPVIWGPSYASGASVFGALGRFDYAVEVKNAALSSRPETWPPSRTQWQDPTFSGRLGYSPNEMWNIGFSASAGTYLQSEAAATLLPGYTLDQYREVVLGQDVSFAWHHTQVWAEVYEARFEIPGVGNADTQAYYVEAKYKVTPQFFCALRWNQQLFSSLTTSTGRSSPWSRDVWRVDVGPGYRMTSHTQVKVQYSLEHQDADLGAWSSLLAVQFSARF
jgi:hypothetical protein